MASDPSIRAALEAAAMTQCCDNWDEMDASDHAVAISFTAPAIAAFLRALPDRFPMPGAHNPDCQVWGHARGEMAKIAAAVEAEGTE